MKERILHFFSNLYSRKLILGIFGALIVFMTIAYVVDQNSINKATDRQTRQVPDANDPSTWTLFPFSPTVLPEEQVESNRFPFVSSTTTYPLNYENLASGKIAISGIILNRDRYDYDNHTGFGFLLFNKSLSNNCFPLTDNDVYTCEGFKEGMFRLLDVVGLPTDEILPDYGFRYPVGLALFEYDTDFDKKIFLVALNAEHNKNIYYVDEIEVVDLPLGNSYSLLYENNKFVYRNFYFNFKVRGSDLEKSFTLEAMSVKDGYISRFSEREGDKIINKFKHYHGHFDSDTNSTKYNNKGTLAISYDLNSFWLNEFYVRPELFSPWNTTIVEDMYHKDDCGLPYSFSDMALNVEGSENLYARLKVSIPDDKTYYNLTTAMYGYDPEQWGTVVDIVDVQAYRDAITKGIPFNGYATESLSIAGVSVRHTLPFNSPRPCDGNTRESYQWVKDGNIYTLELPYEMEERQIPMQKDFIRNVLEEVIAGANYVPSPTI